MYVKQKVNQSHIRSVRYWIYTKLLLFKIIHLCFYTKAWYTFLLPYSLVSLKSFFQALKANKVNSKHILPNYFIIFWIYVLQVVHLELVARVLLNTTTVKSHIIINEYNILLHSVERAMIAIFNHLIWLI